jgi:hypothetical protein
MTDIRPPTDDNKKVPFGTFFFLYGIHLVFMIDHAGIQFQQPSFSFLEKFLSRAREQGLG